MSWRKSTYSNPDGNCVEVDARWRKASYSFSNGNCIEILPLNGARLMLVRDSQDKRGPKLAVQAPNWASFLDRVRTAR